MNRLLSHFFCSLVLFSSFYQIAEAKNATKKASSASSGTSSSTTSGKSKSKYGMAGCGLGSIIMPNDTMPSQIGAMTSNAFSGNQTFALTLGMSNCVEGRSEVAIMEQEVYIAANLNSLSKEAAQGSGEHLDALADVFGCNEVADKERLGQLSQSRFSELFSDKEPAVVLSRYLTVVNGDPLLAQSCSKAS